MNRHELTNDQWGVVAPIIPPQKKGRGRPRADDRTTLNGIVYVLKVGSAWMDMPLEYGSYTTAWRRLQQWQADGTWERIWRALLGQLDERGDLDWLEAALDGSFVPAKKGAMGLDAPR
jgi:transposase